ncbi:MAG: Asp-tRNA(Asn)/Glu-tRNA(Gln) amidotransferase subunit GatB [Deltaproteobacteria bacterium]|nr:Asp-tRNA(Asn)/Glu-tRNA(Gln) amidotransferase subunit GatB [Deltaproteobacteria bacterium]
MEFESVIGLEVHAQLKTKTKIFCSCSAKFGALPNTNVCPVCLGMPGSLPTVNKKVIEFAILAALAVNCKISSKSIFARKNYFYPDLPKGYQISQYEAPIAEHGRIVIADGDISKQIGITRIHMEEDAGKLIHSPDGSHSKVDLNRTGVPLIEIVSEPDIRSAEEAGAYLRKLRSILRYLDICDGNMEEGSFRCDANISIRPKGVERLGTRTELKNLNSFRHVENAINYEIERQIDIISEGNKIIQETRLWDSDKKITTSMRGKEDAHDYRYFPDPDLLPIIADYAWIEKLKEKLPELGDDKKARFISEYKLSEYDAVFLTNEKEIADYFEECAKLTNSPKQCVNWIMGELTALLKANKIGITNSPISYKQLAELINLITKKVISSKIAKQVFAEVAETGKNPKEIVEKKGLVQVSDEPVITAMAKEVIAENPKEASDYKAGKKKLLGFFVGQVMKKSKGKASPQTANKILASMLEK